MLRTGQTSDRNMLMELDATVILMMVENAREDSTRVQGATARAYSHLFSFRFLDDRPAGLPKPGPLYENTAEDLERPGGSSGPR